MKLNVISAKDLRDADFFGKSDPYVEVYLNEYIKRTEIIKDNDSPVWNA